MPTLTYKNFTDWVEHATAYTRAAGWGQGDLSEVFTEASYDNVKVKQQNIKTAPSL